MCYYPTNHTTTNCTPTKPMKTLFHSSPALLPLSRHQPAIKQQVTLETLLSATIKNIIITHLNNTPQPPHSPFRILLFLSRKSSFAATYHTKSLIDKSSYHGCRRPRRRRRRRGEEDPALITLGAVFLLPYPPLSTLALASSTFYFPASRAWQDGEMRASNNIPDGARAEKSLPLRSREVHPRG